MFDPRVRVLSAMTTLPHHDGPFKGCHPLHVTAVKNDELHNRSSVIICKWIDFTSSFAALEHILLNQHFSGYSVHPAGAGSLRPLTRGHF
jgi:hypothetical protein